MSQESKNRTGNWKYTALSSSDINTEIHTSNNSETSPLLQNMENEEFARNTSGDGSVQSTGNSGFVKIQRGSHMTSSDINETSCKKEKSSEGFLRNLNEKKMNNTEDNGNNSSSVTTMKKEEHNNSDIVEHSGARPKTKNTENTKFPTDSGEFKEKEGKLDIVRKMSDLSLDKGMEWKSVGLYGTLKSKRCQRLYAKTGRADDLALFYINGKFYAMEAWCTHMGGPLFDGDIESYNGRCHVMCPWHSYMFDLETGNNEIGLQQKVFNMKYENGYVYIQYHSELSTRPESSRKISRPTGPPPVKVDVGPRKTSILESPFQLT